MGEAVQLGELQGAVNIFDVAEDAAGADGGELLVITPIHNDVASRLDGLLWSTRTNQARPIETTFETTA